MDNTDFINQILIIQYFFYEKKIRAKEGWAEKSYNLRMSGFASATMILSEWHSFIQSSIHNKHANI